MYHTNHSPEYITQTLSNSNYQTSTVSLNSGLKQCKCPQLSLLKHQRWLVGRNVSLCWESQIVQKQSKIVHEIITSTTGWKVWNGSCYQIEHIWALRLETWNLKFGFQCCAVSSALIAKASAVALWQIQPQTTEERKTMNEEEDE
jgi:hypothetical protein